MRFSRPFFVSLLVLTSMLPANLHSQLTQVSRHKTKIITNPTACAPGYSPYEDKYDVSFYFIDLEVTNQSTFIMGSSTLHAKRIAEEIDTFVVELSKKLYVDSVFLQDTKQTIFFHQGDLLKIAVPLAMKTEPAFRLKVYYHGIAGTGGFFAGISSANVPYVNKRYTYTLSEPFQGKDWFPVKQNLTDKADSSWVFITVDSTLEAGSNGLLTAIRPLSEGRSRYEWKSNFPIAYYLLSITVGDYIDYSYYTKLSDTDSMLVQNYIYNSPGNLEDSKAELDQTGVLLKMFSEAFGRYPFASEKYGHCQAPIGGGMEHQTMTTITSFDFGLVSHELAHQWFGDYLTCGSWQDIWINEGFASYAEYIAIEKLKTKADAVAWLVEAHNHAINYPFEGVFLTPDESQNIQRIFNFGLTYRKGGAILHMLRYEINNDSLFFAILRDYVSRYANSTATGEDFRQIVEIHTGENYKWFFDQWYYGKGHPVFISNWRQIGDSLIISSSQTSSAGGDSFFRTHMDYRIHYKNDETEDFRVFYDKPEEVFRINSPKEILYVQMDPYSNVLKNAVVYKYADLKKVFSLSPNPFKNELNLSFRNSNQNRDVKLTSITGRVVYNLSATSGSLTLNLSNLKPGIYLLNVTEDGNTYTEKVIKQ